MQISRATEYALLGLACLSRDSQRFISTREIAQVEKISLYFLRNVFRKLRSDKIVTSTRGGGYRLAKPANQISLREIVEAVEGKVCLHECLAKKRPRCRHSADCKILAKWSAVQKNFLRELDKIKLAELI